jgi:hypothetical protein
MGIPQNELDRYVKPLVEEGKIQVRIFGDLVYYEIKNRANGAVL